MPLRFAHSISLNWKVTTHAGRQLKNARARWVGHRTASFSEHYSGEGAIFYKHACALGCEGIVSKRLGSPYLAGRAGCWIKVKNPAAPAVTPFKILSMITAQCRVTSDQSMLISPD
jgi:ATP-dependent DNA ligase